MKNDNLLQANTNNVGIRKCLSFKYCGGCTKQGIDYQNQLNQKQKQEEKLFSKFCKVNKIIGMEDPLHYRNKVQVSFGKDENGNIIVGNYVPSTHIIVPFDDCMIIDEGANCIIKTIKELVIKYHISVFNEHTYKGCLRHVLIRCSSLNEYMVVFVTGIGKFPKAELFIKDLLRTHKNICTVVQNINSKRTSMILGDKNYYLYGKGKLKDKLCGLTFNLSANTFYQVNKRQTEILYNTAISLGQFNHKERVIDAYCGIGTISLCVAKKVNEVIGVEINSQSIKDAIRNGKENKIDNCLFINDDAGHFMQKLSKKNEKIDAVIMDPPRSGADNKFLNSLVNLRPKKIIYISCGPLSLKDNLNYLTHNGYKVVEIQPVDMFPFTDHVETVVLLKSM